VTQPTNHLEDDVLSALVDDQLSADDAARVDAHLVGCADCQERVEGFRSVSALLRRLPELEPPRDFGLGPRLVADPPNVVRLRRWYTVTRAAAASLAAVFVLLSAGTLYMDSRPGGVVSGEAARPQVLSAPAAPRPTSAPAAARAAAAPQASPAAAPQPAAGVAAPRPAAPPQADDQVAATTSSRPLPTPPPPTPAPVVQLPAPADAPAAAPTVADPAAPVRTGAAMVGVFAVLSLLATLAVRHRLQHQATHF
jgi:anti-sigma factor RsiW